MSTRSLHDTKQFLKEVLPHAFERIIRDDVFINSCKDQARVLFSCMYNLLVCAHYLLSAARLHAEDLRAWQDSFISVMRATSSFLDISSALAKNPVSFTPHMTYKELNELPREFPGISTTPHESEQEQEDAAVELSWQDVALTFFMDNKWPLTSAEVGVRCAVAQHAEANKVLCSVELRVL